MKARGKGQLLGIFGLLDGREGLVQSEVEGEVFSLGVELEIFVKYALIVQ